MVTDPVKRPVPRNVALDYLRVVALFLMSLIHMWRMILGSSGVDGALQIIGETAPFPFFMAFGITQSRVFQSRSAGRMPFFVLFGAIATVHGYFMWYKPTWEFLSLLWFAALLILLAANLGLTARHLLVFSVFVLLVNSLKPLTTVVAATGVSLLQGPFSPLPWVTVVFVGVAVGLDSPTRLATPTRLLALVATAAAAWAYMLAVANGHVPIATASAMQKWTATSTYLVAGCTTTILLYFALWHVQSLTAVHRHTHRIARFLSDHLLVGTVWHYLIVRALMDGRCHWHLASNGVRSATWMEVGFLSVANLFLLSGSLIALIRGWTAITRRCDRLLRRMPYGIVAAAALLTVVALRAQIGVLGLLTVRWLAFAIMLALALFLEFDRQRRRSEGAVAAAQTP